MPIPDVIATRLAIPAIAAPMTSVSGPDLVIEAARHGVIGSFPTHNAASSDELDVWLRRMAHAVAECPGSAPIAPNLVVHRTNRRLAEDLDRLVQNRVELVITSVGSPASVVGPLHDVGSIVLADVSSMAHVDRALDAGVDGLVLLTAGAGGQTGWANPFAFVRAVRARYDGIIVLAGGVGDGAAILAAQALGADLVYLGTRFIATTESLADADYQAALVGSTMDDVRLSTSVGGIPASLLSSWIDRIEAEHPTEKADGVGKSEGFAQDRLLQNRSAWSAGHSVSAIDSVTSTADLIAVLTAQYHHAKDDLRAILAAAPTQSTARGSAPPM